MFIYQGDFFYNYILSSTRERIESLSEIKINKSYHKREVPKKAGTRELWCLNNNTKLFEIQRNILKKFLSKIPVSEYSYGFISGKSYIDFLKVHISSEENKRFFLKIDIKDFFDSIKTDLVKQSIQYYIRTSSKKESKAILDNLIKLVTIDGHLPQGAITSPSISNIVFRRIDLRIAKYCKKFDVLYSRYADDMLFSSINKKINEEEFFRTIRKILYKYNFAINYRKVKRTYGEISINGFVIAENIRISRKKSKVINTILYHCEQKIDKTLIHRINECNLKKHSDEICFQDLVELTNYLNGMRSFYIMVYKAQINGNSKNKTLSQIKRLEKTIREIAQYYERNIFGLY